MDYPKPHSFFEEGPTRLSIRGDVWGPAKPSALSHVSFSSIRSLHMVQGSQRLRLDLELTDYHLIAQPQHSTVTTIVPVASAKNLYRPYFLFVPHFKG